MDLDCSSIISDKNKPTISKLRILSEGHKLLRINNEDSTNISVEVEKK